MQNKKAFLSILSLCTLLIFVWIFLFFAEAILQENSNNNLDHIPPNATFALRLDGRQIAEQTLFSVFLESKDPEVLKLIQSSVSRNLDKRQQLKNYGIDYLSDIIVFNVPLKKVNVQGILVNVSSELFFKKNMPNLNMVFACKDDVGVMLSIPIKNATKITKSELQKLADQIVSKKQDHSMSKFIQHHGSGKFVESYNKGSLLGESSYFGQSNILFELFKNDLLLSGDFKLNKKNKNQVKPIKEILSPKGLHMSSSIFPSELTDSLNYYLKPYSIELPAISEISLNYNGLKIATHSAFGYLPIPQIELLIDFDENFSIESLISNDAIQNDIRYTADKGIIHLDDELIYYQQISPSKIYIGISKNPKIIKSEKNELFCLRGSLKPLTEVKGGWGTSMFLEMNPNFAASKKLSEHMKTFDIHLFQKNKKDVRLEGKLSFTEGHAPLNEILKFFLAGDFFSSDQE